jgi:rubrerythrin
MRERAPAKQSKVKKPAENSKEFLKVMKEWQKLEDDTIRFSEEMMKMSRNKLIRLTMEMIKNDSQKHKAMQQMLIDSIEKEPFILAPDELNALGDGLNKHLAAEAKSLELADEALLNAEMFVTRYVLSYLIADEQKHHNLLGKLNELKRATVFVT